MTGGNIFPIDHSLEGGLRMTLDSSTGQPLSPKGKENVDHIARCIDLLGNEQFSIRVAATKELCGLGQKAVPALLKALQEGLWYTRECAAQALGHIGDHQAIGPLVKVLEDENVGVRWAAAQALSAMMDEEGLKKMVAVVSQQPPQTARDVVESIRRTSPLAGRRLDELLGEYIQTQQNRGERSGAEGPGPSVTVQSNSPMIDGFRSLWERLRGYFQSRS